ncbi:MAG: GNAT family N-acetyltransferase [Pacificimonas sp.]|jgi:putative acetyltransferase|nr:GNAT family N-acetyltransferase [Pacificimonas sp.]
MTFSIRKDNPLRAEVRPLVEFHLGEMHRASPACMVHAMPPDSLAKDGVDFFTGWQGEELAGFGALRLIEPGHAELKSMRIAPALRGQGFGRAILHFLIREATARGLERLSLETGTGEAFANAIRLYERNGFERCAPFAGYANNDFSVCMTRAL